MKIMSRIYGFCCGPVLGSDKTIRRVGCKI
jgi:hypothetical protein